MTNRKPGCRGGPKATTAVWLLLAWALNGCGTGTQPATAPVPASAAAATVEPSPSSTQEAAAPPSLAGVQPGPVMPASPPVTLHIPVIGVRTALLHLGLRENGALEVPEDTGNGAPASWYNGSPTPGERGPSVILGHVNALGGNKGVFADLRELKAGDEIPISRTDGTTVVFTVDRGTLYNKDSFPTFEVYGNTPGPELRLVTCDGYDPDTGLFDDNYVIYAKLKI